jgi:hypothetical protein
MNRETIQKAVVRIVIVMIAAFTLYSLYLIYRSYEFFHSTQQSVLIVYSKGYMSQHGYVLKAYTSVLEEEGVSFETVEIYSLIETTAKDLAQKIPVIIFPDGVAQSLPKEAVNWTKQYLANAGNIAVIYDAGIKAPRGYFLDKAIFADIIGINYMMFNKIKEKAYTIGSLKFASQQKADSLQIPPGKTDEALFLSSYMYGKLTYPMARNEYMQPIPESNIFASIITQQGEKYPAIVHNRYGNGNVLYVNLPLGYLKAYSDDLPLRAILRTFLFQTVKIPHLVNTNHGRGKLVINWHIDSNAEWREIPNTIANQYLDQTLRSSIHITAGDFRDEEGDQLGFDACGRGRTFAQQYLPYGIIGSHGGWAHNWFADEQVNQRLWTYEIKKYINKNKKCLESITNYPIVEYSAPAGVHPQPVTTKILENLGFNSYYYTGDNGSAPNRTFFNGKMVSKTVIAFPMLPNTKYASLYEMKQAGLTEKDVQKWLTDFVDYVIDKRTTRLFYSHIHDIGNYPQAVRHFLQYAKLKQTQGKLQVEPMADIANFLQRFIKTQYVFRHQGSNFLILLKNAEGLKGITVALPRHSYRVDATPDISQSEDENYYYMTVQKDVKEKTIIAHGGI